MTIATRVSMLMILGAAVLSHPATAQTGTAQKGAASSGAVMQKQGTASSTQQECGKPNAQGVTVICPGNQASKGAGNPVGNPSGTGIGSQSAGVPKGDGKIPGVGAQQPTGRSSESGQPTAAELRDKLQKEKERDQSAKGKEVGPEYFSREQQLKDLANPSRGVTTPGGVGANAGLNTPKSGAGAPTVGTVTVGRGEGRNEVSKEEQLGKKRNYDTPTEKEWKDFNRSGYDPKTGGAESAPKEVPKSDPPNKGDDRPNPDAVGGGGKLPKGISGKDPKKTAEQYQTEQKRQVTLPSDNQRRATERVTVSAETARAMGKGGNTGGNIDPGQGDGTSTGPGKKPTRGLEKVDGTPGNKPDKAGQ